MSEDSKYYVPDLSEFHVGFIFECLDKGLPLLVVANADDISEVLANYEESIAYYEEYYRVKFLDKSDIESCGWVQEEVKENVYPEIKFTKHKDKGGYGLFVIRKKIMITVLCEDDDVLFIGTIRNLSELVTLMKMLGINE